MEVVVQNNDVVINRGNFEAAHEAIKKLNQRGQNTNTLEEMLTEWFVGTYYDEFGNITGVSFFGTESFFEELFTALAPYIRAGSYIELLEECGEVKRWNFDGKTMQEQQGKVVFENQHEENPNAYENKVVENAFGYHNPQRYNRQISSWRSWAKTSQYGSVQQTIEGQLEVIINMYFKGAGDYALEKLVKTFCEPLGMLERHLVKTEFQKINTTYGPNITKQYEEVQAKIIKALNSEVRRQARHFITFLSEVGTYITARTGG